MITDWRFIIKLVLYVSVFEGALRKWFVPGLKDILYFAKDIILVYGYFLFFAKVKSPKLESIYEPIKPFIPLVLVFLGLQVFNPVMSLPPLGLFGLKNYLLYVPLIIVVPHLFRSKGELVQYLTYFLYLMIPLGILGFVQYRSPQGAWINKYVAEEAITVAYKGKVRIVGPFSYIGGYTAFLSFIFTLAIALLTAHEHTFKQKMVLYACVGLCLVNMLMTGSRGVVFSSILVLFIYLAVQFVFSPVMIGKLLPKVVLGGFLALVVVVRTAAFETFVDRVMTTRTESDGRLSPTKIAMQFIDLGRYDQPFGYGIGTGHQAAYGLVSKLGLRLKTVPPKLENETDRILVEIGPLGFLIWYGMRVALLFVLFNAFLRLKSTVLRNLALAAFAHQLLLIHGQVVFHHNSNLNYWFLAGLAGSAMRIQRNAQKKVQYYMLVNQEEIQPGSFSAPQPSHRSPKTL